MRPKRNTVLKVRKHVVTFADDSVSQVVENPRPEQLRMPGSLGPRGPSALLGHGEVDPLLTVHETAALLRCSVHSLNKWRLTGSGPRFVRVGSRVRYPR